MPDYYEILEVAPDATQEQIKAQYHFLVQAWHPDKFNSPESKAKAEEKLKRINEANMVLLDPAKRREYDSQRASSGSLQESAPPPAESPQASRAQPGTSPKKAADGATSHPLWDMLSIELTPGVAMEFVRVPAGEFLMGSQPGQDRSAYPDEQPQHKVHLGEYLIGKYPVTNRQYQAFFRAAGHDHWENGTIPSKPLPDPRYKENHPVVSVSWRDAVAFCAWVSTMTGFKPRLPTEAEWEKAARGPNARIYPWGNNPPDHTLLNFDRKVGDTSEVGKYPAGASPYGALDMAGNAWEWVNDFYDEHYYRHSPSQHPPGPLNAEYHVLRGGSWASNAASVRAALRLPNLPTDAGFASGFRCLRELAP